LLKGATVVRWLYDEGERRQYTDADLLIRPGQDDLAAAVLEQLGFEPELDERAMPGWWHQHALGWQRQSDGMAVDLHRTLAGVGVDAERLWSTFSASTEPLVVGGFPARVLPLPARVLHLALHAAHHGAGYSWPLADLERALERADERVWLAAAGVAESLDATSAFATGLRLVPAGQVLATRLALPTELSVETALRVGMAPAAALAFDQLARTRGFSARLAIVGHRLAPPATFMRAWSPLARRGPLGLALAYAWRPLWCVWQAPRGLRVWRAARGLARARRS
ncbi:MAG: nucleotidyltransferase family protein, partial [Actinobacteria bacterium]|nr:nucleotidyltransferase family protein [Actinomycetota bacterium]